MQLQIEINRATEKDVKDIFYFLKSIFIINSRFNSMSFAQFRNYFELISKNGSRTFILRNRDNIIGHFQIFFRYLKFKNEYIKIGGIGTGCVQSKFRRHKVASYMLNYCEDELIKSGIKYTALFAAPHSAGYYHAKSQGYANVYFPIESLKKIYCKKTKLNFNIRMPKNKYKIEKYDRKYDSELITLFNKEMKPFCGYVVRTLKYWRKWYLNPQYQFSPKNILILKKKSKINGYIQFGKFNSTLRILDIVVSSEEKGRVKIFLFLLNKCIKEAYKNKCKFILLYPNIWDFDFVESLKKLGFFQKFKTQALLMKKHHPDPILFTSGFSSRSTKKRRGVAGFTPTNVTMTTHEKDLLGLNNYFSSDRRLKWYIPRGDVW